MKRFTSFALAMIIVLVVAGSAHARGGGGFRGGGHHHFHGGGHSHVIVGFGPSFYFGPPWSPYWYEPPYVVAPPVVVDEPPVAGHGTWYYCTSARAYYPAVTTCAEPWVPVPARN
jgi:hypothetical protein